MRSFISLHIDAKSKESIKDIQRLLKIYIDKPDNARFETPANFHVTLFFIGDIDKVKLAKVYKILKQNIENKYGELNFKSTEINAFPDLRKPKVFFLNCINTGNKIFEIAETIRNILREFEFTSDKDFLPHITLARVKNKIKLKDLSDINIDINFSASKISIMQSRITTAGAEHKEIFAINL